MLKVGEIFIKRKQCFKWLRSPALLNIMIQRNQKGFLGTGFQNQRVTNKADCWRIDAFELWCWRLISVPWTARRSKLAILKEISSEYSLGLMLELKTQYFGHLMQRADSFEKTLMQGKSEAERRRGRQRMRLLDSNSMDMSLRKLRKLVMHREARCALEHWVVKSQTWLSSDNSELNWIDRIKYILGPRKKN